MRILVDTNVFLDYLLKREDYESAAMFLKLSFEHKNPLYVTSISIRDIGYAAHRFYHDKEKTRQIQMAVYQICRSVIDITSDDTINSLFDDEVDFEDSLIKEAAERSMIDVIITNNVKDFRKLGFPSLTPSEMNAIYLK